MRRSARVHINRSAQQHNLQRCRVLAPNSQVLAVIKANAYGHDMLRTAEALSSANGFAVSCLQEAIELRHAGFIHPIVVLQGFQQLDELKVAAEHHLRVTLHDYHQLELLDIAPPSLKIDAAIKFNTGMNRLGFPVEVLPVLHERIQQHRAIKPGAWLMTHLACADERNNPHTQAQLDAFHNISNGLQVTRSIANSAGILGWSSAHANWIRPGIMLHGSSPFADSSAADERLQAAMTFSAPLIAIHNVRKGESIGYGATYTCETETMVGIVACGYADGYPRHAPSGTPVWINGEETQLLGRVSMDMIVIDLSRINATVGDHAELWGKNISVDRVAQAAGTISYEILCNAGNLCPHV